MTIFQNKSFDKFSITARKTKLCEISLLLIVEILQKLLVFLLAFYNILA